jgi:hypothetical protein
VSSWNRDSPEALVVVQKLRIAELETQVAALEAVVSAAKKVNEMINNSHGVEMGDACAVRLNKALAALIQEKGDER